MVEEEQKEEKEEYEIIIEGQESIMKIDYSKRLDLPSIEDNPMCMSHVIDYLAEASGVSRIVLVQNRDYEYDFNQTQMLVEIANLFKVFYKNRELFGFSSLVKDSLYNKCSGKAHSEVQELITRLMKKDPVGCYVELHRLERREKRRLEFPSQDQCRGPNEKFVYILSHLINEFEKTRLIHLAKPFIAGYTLGDREVYRRIFSPTIKPDFMYTKLMASYPRDGTELDNYMVGDAEVTIFQLPGTVQYLYHVTPPEFKLSEDKYEILDVARNIMADHKPQKSEFVDPERMRQVFYNIGRDLIEEVAEQKKVSLRSKEVDELTEILVRYTIGFGLIEVLLADDKVQDISINSPLGQSPIFIVHQDYSDCNTNVIPTQTEAESWATKLRLMSGRPLDEANPILDTELEIPGASTRVSAITNPLDPTGLAFSFRRHRDKPWTLPLFMKFGMINSTAAGLISFLVDGTRTMLIAGTRSSGKSSFLGSVLVEIMRRYRIITIEDTLELPVRQLRSLGYNIQQMKVASALATSSENEVSAGNGIRATLRLGDSALIVGEVRSSEAKALYEAMRVGAAANVVAGTIHGDSPYGVFDRVVNDIGVPKTSFKATDIIITANPVRSPDGIHRMRRVTSICEVRKFWNDDPLSEGGFVDLMKYNPVTDTLEVTPDLQNGDSEILKAIGGTIKDFAGNWDAIWSNIELRGKIKQKLLDVSVALGKPEMLEASFVIKANDQFHRIVEEVREEIGSLDNNRIYVDWESWLKREVKK